MIALFNNATHMRPQTNFSLAASFWAICLLSFFCDD